jgi:rhodanese-related sulfurtransferase
VYSLLFGMSSWNTSTLDSWTPNCADMLSNPDDVNNENPNRTEQTFPTLSGSAGTIVATRVAEMLQNGFKGISYEDMLNNPAGLGDYYIINYFGADDYMGSGTAGTPGHIPGAFQFTPYQSLGIEEQLKYVPANKKVVVYCWTGQHSSQITAYLNMLGYDAYSLKFGSNNLFHSDLTAHKWSAAGAGHDFPLVTTPPSVAVH